MTFTRPERFRDYSEASVQICVHSRPGGGFLFVFFNVRVNKFHCVITRIADVVGVSLSVDE